MHKERILALADVIEELEMFPVYSKSVGAQTFSMSFYSYDCGSPACIAGWASYTGAKEGFQFESVGAFGKGAEYLGLTDVTASSLFLASNTRHDIGELTPAAAAWVLRNLAETGRVAWSKAMKVTDDGTS